MKMYLRFFRMMAFAAMILVIGCDKDDPAPAADSLIGSWKYVSEVYSACTDPDDNYTDTCTSSCDVLVITATTISDGTDTYTYTKSGSTLTINLGSGLSMTATFSVSGNTLTISGQDSPDDGNCKFVVTYTKV